MTTYYVITPFDPMTEEEFLKNREQIAKEGRKCMAIVFNCENYEDFKRKYFNLCTSLLIIQTSTLRQEKS